MHWKFYLMKRTSSEKQKKNLNELKNSPLCLSLFSLSSFQNKFFLEIVNITFLLNL